MKRLSVLGLLLLVLFCGCNPIEDEPVSLREKIGQMLVVGFRGTTPAQLESESYGAKYYIQELGVGGVVLYSIDVPSGRTEPRNIESPAQLQQLNKYLKNLSKHPLMVAVDQEGGNVARLSPKYGFPSTQTAQYLGTQATSVTLDHSSAIAQTLKEAHFNTNFAPCVDVNVNPDSPAIGHYGRSFSADTAVVTAHAKAWIEGHHKSGILTSLKHFPGHGSALNDSHLGMTDVTDTWMPYELAPYRDLIKSSQVDMVMISHVFHRDLDSDYPASLSKKIIGGILREQLGFKGVVISDDINMNAIVEHYSFEHALELAINAGTDMLILSNNGTDGFDELLPLRAIDIIEDLVNEGKISTSRIDEAYRRIIQMKSTLR